jgi:peptidoglycan/LPS O-acetylase OafA/YrhL
MHLSPPFSDRLFPSIRNKQRNKVIDALRGLSILMVVGSHFSLVPKLFGKWFPTVFSRPISNIGEGMGYYGVTVFFVISGFLITSISMKRYGSLPAIDFSGFWWMRFSRVIPMLLVCFLLMTAFYLAGINGFEFYDFRNLVGTVAAILSFRFYEVLGAVPTNVWNPLWSLSVEEIFYLVFPFVCLCLNGWGSVTWVMLVLFGSGMSARISGVSPYYPASCMDLLALGALIAICRPGRLKEMLSPGWARFLGALLCAAGLALITFCVLISHPFVGFPWAPLLCGLGAGMAIVASQLISPGRVARWTLLPVSALGVVSYEVYLLHMPVIQFAAATVPVDGWVALVAVILVGILFHECFSEPMNQTLRGFAPGGAGIRDGARRAEGQDLERRHNTKRCVAIAARPVALVSALLVVYALTIGGPRIKDIMLRFDSIAGAEGSAEPVAYTGLPQRGDLVFLRHEANGKVRFGVDHWGLGSPALSAPLSDFELSGREVEVAFSNKGVSVTMGQNLIVFSPVAAYPSKRPVIVGRNDIGFTSATQSATSSFVRIK